MKKYITTLLFTSISTFSIAQVGVATTSPSSNSILDISSSTGKALLIPRTVFSSTDLKSTTIPIQNPADGLLAFNNDPAVAPNPTTQLKGMYLRVDNDWRLLSSEVNKSTDMVISNSHAETGNTISLSNTYTNFNSNFDLFYNSIAGASYKANVITLPKGRYFGKFVLTLAANTGTTTGVGGRAIHKITYRVRLVDTNNNIISNEYFINSTSNAANTSKETIVGKLNFNLNQPTDLRLQISINEGNSTYWGNFTYYEGSLHIFRGIFK